MISKKQRYDEIGRFADEELYASVIKLAESYLKDFPDDKNVLSTYSFSLRYLSRFDEAKQALLKAMELYTDKHKHYGWLLFSMGQIYQNSGNFQEAIKWFEKAHKCIPEEASFLIYLGILNFRLEKYSEAEQILSKATICKEGHTDEAFYNLGAVLLSQGKYDEASECFQKALEIDPEYEEAKLALKDSQTAKKL